MREVDCLLVGYFGGEIKTDLKKTEPKYEYNDDEMREFNAAVAYLGTFLHRRGFTFDFVNYIEEEYELLVEKLDENVKAVAISTTYCMDNEIVRQLVSAVRTINPSVKIIVGGPHIANLLNYSEDDEVLRVLLRRIKADFYINSYQGESTLTNIIQAIKQNTPFSQVPNIYYKDGNKYIYTETVEEDNNLEENMVDWTLFSDRLGEVVPVRTAISCPFSCAYCNHPVHAGKYRFVSVNAIERELDSIEKTKKVKYVDFVDDTFNVPLSRFKETLKMMIRKQYSFKWFSYIRCQFLDEETVDLMKKSGCIGAMLGVESASQKMLDGMNKRVTVEELKTGITLLQKYGIATAALFFIGFPGETEETVQHTINFINEVKPTYYVTRSWLYDHRTPIGRESEKHGIRGTVDDWIHNTMDSTTAKKLVEKTISEIKHSYQAKYTLPQIDKLACKGLALEQIYNL